jgi:hypothetical protein
MNSSCEPAPFKVDCVLADKPWTRVASPFSHIRAQEVFRPAFYEEIQIAVASLLSRGLCEGADPERFSRTIPTLDAYVFDLSPHVSGALRIFISPEWHQFLSQVSGLQVSDNIVCCLHHHPIRSKSGRIHNDLNPGWFLKQPDLADTKPTLPSFGICDYKTGSTAVPDLPVVEEVRALAMIFYVNNPPWCRGDGGETGLYNRLTEVVEDPICAVPPLNNSLVIFECTPFSFHSFIRNRRHARTSLIMWLHRPMAAAIERWGKHSIAYWTKRDY